MTSNDRSDLGFGEALADVGNFKPSVKKAPKINSAIAAEISGFKSREAPQAQKIKSQRRRRTGRSAQINIKTTPQAIQEIYQLADSQGWGLGETFERAISLLAVECGAGKNV